MRRCAQEGDTGKSQFRQDGSSGVLYAGLETKRAGGFMQGDGRVRRRIVLGDEGRIEGLAAKLAQAAEQPQLILPLQASPRPHPTSPDSPAHAGLDDE